MFWWHPPPTETNLESDTSHFFPPNLILHRPEGAGRLKLIDIYLYENGPGMACDRKSAQVFPSEVVFSFL